MGRWAIGRLGVSRCGLALIFGLGGCYAYVPMQLATVPPRAEVKVRVTDAGAARLVKDFGAYTTELEGQLGLEGSDSVSVAVAIAREYRGLTLESARQVLYLGRTEVVEVRHRQLSRKRTVLASAGAVVAFTLLVKTVVQWGDPNPPAGEPPGAPPAPLRGGLRFSIP